jgi:hypothetical protein
MIELFASSRLLSQKIKSSHLCAFSIQNSNAALNCPPSHSVRVIMGFWEKFPSTQQARQDGACAVLKVNGEALGIVTVGGQSRNKEVNQVELFEWKTKRWWALPSISQSRCGCAAASTGSDVVVVLGGYSGNQRLDTAESFTFGSKEWVPLPNMTTPRWYPAAVGLGRHNSIIVVGGRNDFWQELSSAESLNLTSNTWQTLAPMKIPRFACAAVAIGPSRVMVIGGYDGRRWVNSVEAYDMDDDEWSDLPPMPVPLTFVAATTVLHEGRYVFVVGGQDTRDEDPTDDHNEHPQQQQPPRLDAILCYNVRERKWTKVEGSTSVVGGVSGVKLEGCALASIGKTLIAVGGSSSGADATKQAHFWALSDEDFLLPISSAASVAPGGGGDNNTVVSRGAGSHQQPTVMTTASSTGSGVPDAVGVVYGATSVAAAAHLQNGMEAAAHMPNGIGLSPPAAHAPVVEVQPVAMMPLHSDPMGNKVETRNIENSVVVDERGEDGWYTGEVSVANGKPHGRGMMRWDYSGDVYEGEWRQGSREGQGKMTFANGDSFKGWFVKDKKHGRGEYKWKGGRQYSGLYGNDKAEDSGGTMTWKDGTKYVGQFSLGQRTGHGLVKFPNGVHYQGDFTNGKYEGFGTCVFSDGRVYTGNWKAGKAHGKGKLSESDGVVLHDGEWAEDVPVFS